MKTNEALGKIDIAQQWLFCVICALRELEHAPFTDADAAEAERAELIKDLDGIHGRLNNLRALVQGAFDKPTR